jgi:hypothetical protein
MRELPSFPIRRGQATKNDSRMTGDDSAGPAQYSSALRGRLRALCTAKPRRRPKRNDPAQAPSSAGALIDIAAM